MRVHAYVLTAAGLAACLVPAGAGPVQPRPQPKLTAFHSVKEMTRTIQKLRRTRPKGAGGYLEAYLYQLRMRAFPNDTVDWKRWDAATAHRSKMPAAHIGTSRGGIRFMGLGERWQFVGPRNLATPYRLFYGEGKLSGRINAVAYDAGHPGTYYLASSGGGVWKSTDSGANWTPLSDDWTYLKASSIALDPSNTNTVYVGTGDFDGSSAYCMGIMKSTDGGATWTNYGQGALGDTAVSALVVDPDSPNIVLAAAGKGRSGLGYVWRSTDAGVTWSPVVTASAAWSDLKVGAMPAVGGARAYYATGIYNGGHLWRSTDQGATWTRLSPPITPGAQYDQNSLECATSPTDPGTVYLVSGFDQKIFKSANYGAAGSWTDITGNFPNGTDSYNWSQRWYDIHAHCTTRTVAGSPVDVLYVGLITLAQSLSGDSVWRDVGLTYTNSALTHNDAHAMAFDPTDPNKALVGNDGGVYRYRYDPGADAWSFDTTLSSTLGVTEFYRIAPHPTNPDKILGGTQDNASPLSTGDLLNWSNVGQGDGGFCVINPVNPLTQYATAQFLGVFRTKDEWATTIKTTPSTGTDYTGFIAPIAISPSNPRFLYGGTNYLWRWDETTASWAARLGGQALAGVKHYVTYIGISPSDGNRIYTGSDDGQLWMTANGGSNWQLIGSGVPSLPNRAITSISVSPTDPSDILVGLSGTGTGHLWRCANTQAGAARTWTNLSGAGVTALPDVPVNAIALDPDAPSTTFYVATDVGVMATQDGGLNWANATQPLGLPNVQVNDLVMVPGTRNLYAGTYGRGIWRIGLPNGLATRLALTNCSGAPGSSVNLSATLTKSLDGSPLAGKTIGFTVAGTSVGSTLTDAAGAASVPYIVVDTFASPTVGTGAAFMGDGTYGASSVIGRLDITPTTSSLAVADVNGFAGGNVDLTATLTRPTDNGGAIGRLISFSLDGTAVGSAATAAGGTATLSYLVPAVTTVGAHALGAAFAGDALYGASSGAGTLTIAESGLPVTYLVVNNRSNIGPSQSVPLGAYLKRAVDNTGLGSRTVTFKIDGSTVGSATTINSGTALMYWTSPTVFSGTHEIRAEFAGDVAYLSCYGIGYINPGATSATSLSVAAASGSFGQAVTLSATLTKSADGSLLPGKSVSFSLGGTSVGSASTSGFGVAAVSTVLTDSLVAGANTISTAFAGDSSYSACNGTGTLTVVRTATSTVAHDAAGEAGSPVSLTATLTRSTDTAAVSGRTVGFAVASTDAGSATTDAAGVATTAFTIPAAWTAGSYPVAATFAGDTRYLASSGSANLAVTVPVTSATNLAASDATAAIGATASLTATLTKSGDGSALAGRTISFTLDATAVGTAVTGATGAASLGYAVPEAAAPGAHPVGAAFAGEAAYLASSAAATLTVTMADTALTAANASGTQGGSVSLSATLKRSTDNALLAGRSIAFGIDASAVGSATTNASGVASLAYA
ncbi:MAG: Ig-like domain repeat protein, partial [Armatimonadetes bacterium]|nr:Ig-like domain repeat protein [Armatimonadota bacterium]